MNKSGYLIIWLLMALALSGCIPSGPESGGKDLTNWKQELPEILSVFGHRNWILVVDKAFPAQTAGGIRVIDTRENLPGVLAFVLKEIKNSTHVKPVVYTDKELGFITEELVQGIDNYRNGLFSVIGSFDPQVMLHDSVFVKIDQATKLFRVLVLKTEEVIPYSSVFIELDCKYWSGDNEQLLRQSMSE